MAKDEKNKMMYEEFLEIMMMEPKMENRILDESGDEGDGDGLNFGQ